MGGLPLPAGLSSAEMSLIVCRCRAAALAGSPAHVFHGPASRPVRRLCKERGLSQEELALCGVHRAYVSGVEHGVRNPTVGDLEKITVALDAQAHELLLPTPADEIWRRRRKRR
jgi:hypothetical protein